jgi:hypothetical protein
MCVSACVRHVPPLTRSVHKLHTGKIFSPNWLHFLVTCRYSDYCEILSSLATIPGIGAKWRGHIHSVPSRSDGDSGRVGLSCQGKSKSGLFCLIVVNVIENILD